MGARKVDDMISLTDRIKQLDRTKLVTLADVLASVGLADTQSHLNATARIMREHGWSPAPRVKGAPRTWIFGAEPAQVQRAAVPDRTETRLRRERTQVRSALEKAYAEIDALEDTVAAFEQLAAARPARIAPHAFGGTQRHATAVALLSDVHAEERVVRTDAIHNEYDLEIAQRRVGRFFSGVTWLVQHAARDFAIDGLVLWLGGDLITNQLHEESAETGALPPAEAILVVRDWIVSGVRQLLAELPDVPRIAIPCSIGNHGRTTKRMRATTGYGHSWEWLMYHVLAGDFAGEPRVSVHATRDLIQYQDVYGYRLAFHHGHSMRYNGGVGGITIPATKQVLRWQQWQRCDYYHFGHFHTQLDLGAYAFNGSVIGPNAYALSIGASPEPPQQSFYLLDSKRGKTHVCPVWVGE
jgi:hypothetical protein